VSPHRSAGVVAAFAIAAAAAATIAACSGDPQHQSAAAGATGASGSAPGAGGTSSTGSGDGGGGAATSAGGSGPVSGELALEIQGPPEGTAFERRWVSVRVTYSAPSPGATLILARGGSVIEEIPVAPVKDGAASLRLPLARGETPFTVSLAPASGEALVRERTLYGGRLVAAGQDTRFAIHGGKVAKWGAGDPTPKALDAAAPVTTITASGGKVLALDADGRVLAPSEVDGSLDVVPGLEDIVAVAPGGGHTLFLHADGKVFAAGSNDRGQLGVGDTEVHDAAVEVLALADVVAVAASDDASFAVAADGSLSAWGSNGEGQLGLGDEDASPHPQPVVVPGLGGVEDVTAGRDHALALTADGAVFAWGLGSSGQLGDGSSGILASKAQPVPITLAEPAIALAAEGNTSYAVLASGALFGWGQNSLAQLGVGDTSPRTKPAACLVGAARNVGAGTVGGLAWSHAGIVYAWGSNASGELGLPLPPDGPERSSAPVEVPPP
jgi:hypothetical protein